MATGSFGSGGFGSGGGEEDEGFEITASPSGGSSISATPGVIKQITAAIHGGGGASIVIEGNADATLAGSSQFSANLLNLGEYGSDSYGSDPYGSDYPPYGIESAQALTSNLVRVRYRALFDQSFSGLLTPTTYFITPSVAVNAVLLESDQTVLLVTSTLNSETFYTVTLQSARGLFGQPLSPYFTQATFSGADESPTFYAVATGPTRVRAVFSDSMLHNAALTDPSKYLLTDLNGQSVEVSSVTAEQISTMLSVALHLTTPLADEGHYRLTITTDLPNVVTDTQHSLEPNHAIFQWVGNKRYTEVPLHNFSGEIQGGLFGEHGGLVFFSPALEASAANSRIQVQEVDVCTRAYDEYGPSLSDTPPIAPPVFCTHGAGLVPTPVVTTLNSVAVLWSYQRLIDVPGMFEVSCSVTLTAMPSGGITTIRLV
jgi:hypothetical protein